MLGQAHAGAELLRQHQRLAVPRGRLDERAAMLAAPRRSRPASPIAYVNQVGGQDDLVFDGGSMVRRARTGRSGTASRSSSAEVADVVELDDSSAAFRPSSSRHEEVWDALVLGTRDYVREERLRRGGGRAVGRRRLVDRRHHRGRRARGRPRARRAHAVALLERPLASPTRSARAPTSGSSTAPSRSSRPTVRSSSMLAPSFDGRDAGPDRGEPPVADPRRHAHGAVEQVRLDGPHHRQQERVGGRVLDAVRRHRRRARGDQGRLQALRVRAVPVAEPTGRPRARPRERAREGAVGRAAPRSDRRPEPAALRGARPDARGATSTAT